MNTTHSIRSKSSLNPILTIAPKLFKRMKESRPEAVTLTLSKFKEDYKRLTGKNIVLDHDQQNELLVLFGAAKDGTWPSEFTKLDHVHRAIEHHYTDGLMRSTITDMDTCLTEAQTFYDILANMVLAPTSSPSM